VGQCGRNVVTPDARKKLRREKPTSAADLKIWLARFAEEKTVKRVSKP